MKAVAIVSLVLSLPGAALAHGGHPEMSHAHELAHLIYFGVPAALVGSALFVWVRKRRRVRLLPF